MTYDHLFSILVDPSLSLSDLCIFIEWHTKNFTGLVCDKALPNPESKPPSPIHPRQMGP